MVNRLRHLAEYLLIRVLLSFAKAIRIETCYALAKIVAWLAADVLGVRRKLTLDNLQIAFPESTDAERRRLARHMWEHLLLMTCEIAQAPRKIHETNWRKYVTLHRKREMVRAFLSPRPKVVVTAHFGNFEIGGYMTNFWGLHTYTVARTLDNPYLDEMVNRFRESMGQIILPKSKSANLSDAVLQTGGALILVGDQHAGDKGVWVEFFGRHASCHKALALFSLLNRAPMLVTYVQRLGRPMQFEVGLADVFDPLDPASSELSGVTELTQWYNDVLEDVIREAPDQYWWLHHRWRDAPPNKRRRKRKVRKPQHADRHVHRPAA